jgi:formate dehydrogenase major subunit
MKVKTQSEKLAEAAPRRDGALHLRPPARLPDLPANGNCELQDMAGAVGLREVRYGYDGANHLQAPKDTSNPYFTSTQQVHRLLALRARLRGGAGHLRADHRGPRLRLEDRRRAAPTSSSECVSCGACVQACPTATLTEKSSSSSGPARPRVVTTCAYCGVGCSFRAEMKGDRGRAHGAHKDGKANHGHSCVKGRFAWGYATHKDRIRSR